MLLTVQTGIAFCNGDSKKRGRIALAMWPKAGLTAVCLLLRSDAGVRLHFGKKIGEGDFHRPARGAWVVSGSSPSVSKSKAGRFRCPLTRNDSLRQMVTVGVAVEGARLGWPWGENEVEKMRKIWVMRELWRVSASEMENLLAFGRNSEDVGEGKWFCR